MARKLKFQAVYDWFMERGSERTANMGGMSNAYVVAYNQGKVPAWVQKGTASYAAACAGLDARKRDGK